MKEQDVVAAAELLNRRVNLQKSLARLAKTENVDFKWIATEEVLPSRAEGYLDLSRDTVMAAIRLEIEEVDKKLVMYGVEFT